MPVIEDEVKTRGHESGGNVAAAAASAASAADVEPYVPDFELGEDVSQLRNQEREAAWASAETEGREQLSAREIMIKYGPNLQSAINAYHYIVNGLMPVLEAKLNLGLARTVVDFLYHDSGRLVTFANMLRNRDMAHFEDVVAGSDTSFQVCIRARPLFPHERADGEYNTILCQPLERRQVTIHEGSLDRSGRRMEMVHHNLMAHKVWDHTVSNEVVCKEIIDPLVEFVQSGKAATVIMYGQTGTGKTYTFQGIFQRLCTLLNGRRAEVTFIEIDGKKTYDLLNERKSVKLLSDSDGNVHIKGAAVHPLVVVPPTAEDLEQQRVKARENAAALAAAKRNPTGDVIAEDGEEPEEDADLSADDDALPTVEDAAVEESPAPLPTPGSTSQNFYATVMRALANRTQLVTERNPVSSRTHAVCQIRIVPENEIEATGVAEHGLQSSPRASVSGATAHVLTLVDLAGSERKYETMHMSVEEHKRSADINYTLMTLRHVFRTFNARVAANAAKAAQAGTFKANGNVERAAFPSTARAGPAELRRMMTKKMTKAREKLRRQADQIVLASHFRGSLLTRILRASFMGDAESHRTKVIATVSPAATDVVHTINTLGQVILMSPFLEQMAMQMEVEVLMSSAKTLGELPVDQWGAEEVGMWLRTADNGRFAEVALPPSITGAQLLQLSQASLAELFGQEGRIARTAGEGESWVITNVEGTRRDHYSKGPRDWGGAIYRSLMRYQEQFEENRRDGATKTPKKAERPKPLKRGSGTGGGAKKTN
eukprot:INCI11091.1.p1 GENE.INCI11091.1~~INCI11091.1.p1  ORF type:complete len:772 (+),score=158.83 INCI11091.1:276-2591(+)